MPAKAAVQAVPGDFTSLAARLVRSEGRRWNKPNCLLRHAMGVETGGRIGAVMAAAIMLSVCGGFGILP